VSGLIVPSDLPDEEKKVKDFVSDLIILRDLPDGKNKTRKGFREWSHCSGRSTQ
jgi:hypothetical protein